MLRDLFQDSDVILLMESDRNKKPTTAVFSRSLGLKHENYPYFTINPIDHVTNRNDRGAGSPRASINVTAFRNFLFESDSLPLDQQESLLRHLATRVPLAQVTFSGSNSLHAIISVADSLPFVPHTDEGIRLYSQAWRALNAELTAIASEHLGANCPSRLFDPACKDPARLSRTPGAYRPDNGNKQYELPGFGGYLSSDDILRLMAKHTSDSKVYYTETVLPDNPDERGQLTKRTLDFINGWSPEHAHIWSWHADFIFAVKDLQSQNYTKEEARQILSTITGHLDAHDLGQINDIWARNNFKLPYRPFHGDKQR